MAFTDLITSRGLTISLTSSSLSDSTAVGRALFTAATTSAQLTSISNSLLTISGTTLSVAGGLTASTTPASADNSTNVPNTAFLATNVVRGDLTQSLTSGQKQVARFNASAPPWDAYAYQNIAYNPRHVISQFYNNASVASVNGYVTDGYVVGAGGIVCSAQRVSSPFTTRPDLKYGLQATVTTAKASLAASDYAIIVHYVEGTRLKKLLFGTSNAQNMAFGVMLKSSLSGTFYLAFENGAATQTFLQKVVLSANVETFVPLIIPGCTTGTWATDTTIGMSVSIAMAMGTTYQSPTVGSWISGNYNSSSDQTNLAATAGATFTMSDLILLPVPATVTDPTTLFPADRLPFFQRQDDDEFRICQRYYQVGTPGYIAGTGGPLSSCTAFVSITPSAVTYYSAVVTTLPVVMRTTPSATLYSPSTGTSGMIWNNSTTADIVGSIYGLTNSSFSYGINNVSVAAYNGLYSQYVLNARM